MFILTIFLAYRFWGYFKNVWLRKTDHHLDNSGRFLFRGWNSSHLFKADGSMQMVDENGMDIMVNRTNNPLERFNRHMRSELGTKPTMTDFVGAVKKISNSYVEKMRLISAGHKNAPKRGYKKVKHKKPHVAPIPEDFEAFVF